MKNLATLLFIISFTYGIAQEKSSLAASMMVTYCSNSKIDYSEESVENIQHLFFFEEEKGLRLINTFIQHKTDSSGRLINCKKIVSKDEKIMHFQMEWHYENNYDLQKGIATVDIYVEEIIDKDYTHWGKVTIKDSNGLDIEYKGPFFYYQDPLKFSNNFIEQQK
jgi:hypothetical protein